MKTKNNGKIIKKVAIGIIGVRGYGQKLAEAAMRTSNLNVAACCHPDRKIANEYSEKYKCRPFYDMEEMSASNEIEGIIIATPNHLHYEHIKACIKNKKHIFVEKPITNTLAEAEEIVKECQDKNITLMVGHNFRRMDAIRKIKKYIDDKKIGEFVSAEINISHSGGMRFNESQWRYYKDKCPGGPLIMAGIHATELSNYFFGPVDMAAARVKKLHTSTETEDTSMLLLELESGGVVYISANYNTPSTFYIRIYGTKGIIEFNMLKQTLTFQGEDIEKKQGSIENVDFIKNDSILEQLEEFGDCILEGKEPETNGEVAINALAIIHAALLSQKENKFIKVKKYN